MEPRSEHDVDHDIFRVFLSENEVVKTVKHRDGESLTVMHLDVNGEPVIIETHGMSKAMEKAKETTRERFDADPSDTTPVATIEWTYIDPEHPGKPEPRTTIVHRGDFWIDKTIAPERTLISACVRLSDRITLSIDGATSDATEEIRGFAINARLNDFFGWDWFEMVDENRYAKIQEGGQVQTEFTIRGDQRAITQTTLLAPISFRSKEMSAMLSPTPHRVNLPAGTTISWPMLVDDRVVFVD